MPPDGNNNEKTTGQAKYQQMNVQQEEETSMPPLETFGAECDTVCSEVLHSSLKTFFQSMSISDLTGEVSIVYDNAHLPSYELLTRRSLAERARSSGFDAGNGRIDENEFDLDPCMESTRWGEKKINETTINRKRMNDISSCENNNSRKDQDNQP